MLIQEMSSELTQDQLLHIAREYFRELLVSGNDQLFRIENHIGTKPDEEEQDKANLAAYSKMHEQRLRELNKTGEAAKLPAHAVKQRLEKLGHGNITSSSDSYGILCRYFVRAEIESNRILRAKLTNDFPSTAPIDPLYEGIMDDTLPPLPEHGLGATEADKTLGPLIKKYKMARSKSWEYKTRLDFTRVLGWMEECLGSNRAIHSITTTDIGGFRDALLKIPKNYTKAKGKSDISLAEAMQQMPDSKTIAPQTAEKYLNMTRAFLNWCESEGYIEKVPGQKISIEYKMPEKPRLPFTNEQLKILFMSPMWAGCFSPSRRSKPGSLIVKNAYYWIPLVAVYTGMRCGEIVQLRHIDILTTDGIPYIDVNDDHQKKLKTKYSRRRIPIHPRLKEWGFMDFLKQRNKGKPEDRIFHEIAISKEGDPSHAYSKAFSRYLKDIGLKNPKLSFHSFRHTVPDALDNASVMEAHKHAMMGHSDKSASTHYGVGASISVLFEAIGRIGYDFEQLFNPFPSGCNIIEG